MMILYGITLSVYASMVIVIFQMPYISRDIHVYMYLHEYIQRILNAFLDKMLKCLIFSETYILIYTSLIFLTKLLENHLVLA